MNEDDYGNKDSKNYSINVGFYLNKYNAEQDLPSIMLNDTSLTEKVKATIINDIYKQKMGFRINISPLSKKNALRACEKIKSTGELCEVSD